MAILPRQGLISTNEQRAGRPTPVFGPGGPGHDKNPNGPPVNPGGPMVPPPPVGSNNFPWDFNWPEHPPFPITPGWHPSSIWQWEGKPRGDW